MLKRVGTPLAKDRQSTARNSNNMSRPLKEIKNIQNKPSLSRNSSNAKLNIPTTEPLRWNPESADRKTHKQVSDEMRRTVVEWMLEVGHNPRTAKNMKKETVFMAIRLFDVGLESIRDIGPVNMQLLAVTALFMSAKYEEIYPQSLKEFLSYTMNSYKRDQILSMQEKILNVMNFKLTFLTRYTHSGLVIDRELPHSTRKLKSLVAFLLELSLLVKMEEYSESELGEAGVFLAAKVLKVSTPQVSEKVMEAAYKILCVWKQNEGGSVAFMFDNENECYVGGLRVIS